MNKLTAVVLCVAIFFGSLVLDDAIKANSSNQTKAVQVQMVQTVCDIAHNENSGESEKACGNVQDQTNTEYICNSTSCLVESL